MTQKGILLDNDLEPDLNQFRTTVDMNVFERERNDHINWRAIKSAIKVGKYELALALC